MLIGYDATSLTRQTTGIEYYSYHLLRALLSIDKHNRYVVYTMKGSPELGQGFSADARLVTCPVDNQVFCEQIWLPYRAMIDKVDIMHFTAFPPGAGTFKKHVATIQDATVWKFPETLSWKGKCYMLPLMTLAAKRAAKVITVSESSLKDITAYTGISGDKVVNTKEAIAGHFRVMSDRSGLPQERVRRGFPDKFILATGSLEPRKNLSLLLEAYGAIKKDRPDFSHGLVLVGRKAWGTKGVMSKIRGLGLEKDVIVTGHVPNEELPAIYNLADVFVFPSIYEGFGIPPVEAMACGVPVIASDTSSIPEVLGDAALYIDPYDKAGLMCAILKVCGDKDLRERMVRKGLERAALYDWENVARLTMSVYESIK